MEVQLPGPHHVQRHAELPEVPPVAARAGSPGGHAPVDAAAGRDQLQRQHQFLGTETGGIGVPMFHIHWVGMDVPFFFHITQILVIFHIVHLQQTLEDLEGENQSPKWSKWSKWDIYQPLLEGKPVENHHENVMLLVMETLRNSIKWSNTDCGWGDTQMFFLVRPNISDAQATMNYISIVSSWIALDHDKSHENLHV